MKGQGKYWMPTIVDDMTTSVNIGHSGQVMAGSSFMDDNVSPRIQS